MNAQQLKNLVRTVLVAQRTVDQEYSIFDSVIDFITQSVTTGIPTWSAVLTFNNNNTGAGAYSTLADTSGVLRFWQSRTNGNINNSPPTDPAVTINTYWQEVSPAPGSAIKEWATGIYGAGLIIVYRDISGTGDDPALYILTEGARPFNSTNFDDEVTAGSWKKMSGGGGGLDKLDVDMTSDPIIIDLNNLKERMFVGTGDVGAGKTWLLYNDAAALLIRSFLFTVSAVADQSMPYAFKMAKFVGDWDNVAKKWTPPATGDYELTASFNGTNWLVQISGPF